jgi:uncharacterized OB-fold protein
VADHGKKPEPPKIRPRIGHWEVDPDGGIALLATRCTACGEVVFPAHTVCARCGSEATETFRLRGPARLGAYTVVHQLPSGFSGPLAVGYGQFDEGVLVLAPIDVPPDQLSPGMILDLHVGQTWVDDDGEPMPSYRFEKATA